METPKLNNTGSQVNFFNYSDTSAETGYYDSSAAKDNLSAIIKNTQIIIEEIYPEDTKEEEIIEEKNKVKIETSSF